ncbi:MAG TPA: SDR family NAD(P)-dependent oxidoreductase [Bryobacteraceae bacterium]
MGTVLITGGHAGLGLEAASRLAANKVNLVLAGRDLSKVSKVAAELQTHYGVKVSTVELDLASFSSIHAAATTVRKRIAAGELDPLQALLCNAGAQFRGPVSYSKDGFEETFATNHLGHFLLVNLLLDCIPENGRIVFTTSETHDPDTMDGKMVGPAVEPDAFALANQGKKGKKPISGGKRYATSKLCNILIAYELDRRLRSAQRNIASIAFAPGMIPETGLARTAPAFAQWLIRTALMKWFMKSVGVNLGSLPFSGRSLAEIGVEPALAEGSGHYFQARNGALVEARSSKVSYDEQRAAKLWRDSEILVGLQSDERPRTLYENR